MIKILFAAPHMIFAGVEKTLIELLKALSSCEYEITVLLVRARGGLEKNIPENVVVKELDVSDVQADLLLAGGAKSVAKYYFKKGRFFKSAKILFQKALGNPIPEFEGRFDEIAELQDEYDYAVCYHMHMPFLVRFIAEKVKAFTKYAWIHNDFNVTKYKVWQLKKYLEHYDRFFAVSKQLETEFTQIFPEYADKTKVVYNLIDKKNILKQGDEQADWPDSFNGKRILSVGRLNKQKGFDLAIEAAKKLRADNLNFRWYIIGEGKERQNLEKKIKKLGLGGSFVLLGAKKNPYPFFRECDIYVQPSRHEGYCTTTSEAKVFCKPIITTCVAGAEEQFTNDVTGLVTKIDATSIAAAVSQLISDEKKCFDFSTALYGESYRSTDVNEIFCHIVDQRNRK